MCPPAVALCRRVPSSWICSAPQCGGLQICLSNGPLLLFDLGLQLHEKSKSKSGRKSTCRTAIRNVTNWKAGLHGLLCCEVWISILTLLKAPRISGASSLMALPARTWSLGQTVCWWMWGLDCENLLCLIPSEDPMHVIQVRAKRTDLLVPSSLTCCHSVVKSDSLDSLSYIGIDYDTVYRSECSWSQRKYQFLFRGVGSLRTLSQWCLHSDVSCPANLKNCHILPCIFQMFF